MVQAEGVVWGNLSISSFNHASQGPYNLHLAVPAPCVSLLRNFALFPSLERPQCIASKPQYPCISISNAALPACCHNSSQIQTNLSLNGRSRLNQSGQLEEKMKVGERAWEKRLEEFM